MMHSNHPKPGHSRLRALLLALALLLAPLLGLAATPALAAPSCTTSGATITCTFGYTGAAQTWTVPAGVTQATFDLYGAQGGSWSSGGAGGKGGHVHTTLNVSPNTNYQILVGGNGGSGGGNGGSGGYNGGGGGGSGYYYGSYYSGGGGGASDVRSGAFALADRLLVAGGGGGDSQSYGGGAGGYPNGSSGRSYDFGSDRSTGGGGGTQSAGGTGGYPNGLAGSLGQGGDGGPDGYDGGGGGGGGYNGGGGGAGLDAAGGGGGSSYGPASATFENGVRTGDGLVIISYTLDTSAPVANPGQTPAANSAGWNSSDVTVSWNWSDGGSGIDSAHCTASSTSSGAGTLTLSATCADKAGNQGSASYTVKVDATAPSVSVSGASYTLSAVPAAVCSTSDALSGVATPASLSLSGTGVGLITATCGGATDAAGNSAPAVSVSYSVVYAFSGFAAPVDNAPIVNVATAGRSIPLQWRLIDASGNPVTTLTSVTVTSVAGGCSATTPTDAVEAYATGASGLQNLGNGYYQYNWQTQKAWAGSCRTLKLDLGDGQPRTALFQFR